MAEGRTGAWPSRISVIPALSKQCRLDMERLVHLFPDIAGVARTSPANQFWLCLPTPSLQGAGLRHIAIASKTYGRHGESHWRTAEEEIASAQSLWDASRRLGRAHRRNCSFALKHARNAQPDRRSEGRKESQRSSLNASEALHRPASARNTSNNGMWSMCSMPRIHDQGRLRPKRHSQHDNKFMAEAPRATAGDRGTST